MKIKNMKKLFSLLSIIVIFSSCEKDVHVDIPKKDPKLVINAILATDSVIRVTIGKTRGVLDPFINTTGGPIASIEKYIVNNISAYVYENGVMLDSLVDDGSHYQFVSFHQKTIKSGNTYTIKASAPGFMQAEATTSVPSQSTITDVTRIKNARTDPDGNPEDEITVKLDDPLETNFYLLQFFSGGYGYSGFGYSGYCVSTTDKDIEPLGADADPFSTNSCYDGSKLMMKDVNFNGRQKQVRFYINSYLLQDVVQPNGQVVKPNLTVMRITEDYFKFVKSYDVYYNSSDNPFAEPSNVYTNVKNGYGIFTAFTEAGREL